MVGVADASIRKGRVRCLQFTRHEEFCQILKAIQLVWFSIMDSEFFKKFLERSLDLILICIWESVSPDVSHDELLSDIVVRITLL